MLDAGFTGKDWVLETGADVQVVSDLIYSKVSNRPARWVLAVAGDSPYQKAADLAGKRIATELQGLTQRYFDKKGVDVDVFYSWGATEAKVVEGLADGIVEVTETGTTIVKIFLNISNEAQRERLQERLDNPEKHWKFNPGDLEDRKLWPQFMQTYQQVIAATDTDHAPWYIVPADSKSGRSLIIVNIMLEHLRKLHLAYPEVDTSGWPQQIE